MDDDPQSGLGEAHAAVAAGDWPRVFELFTQADAAGLVAPGDLPAVADASYGAGHLDATIELWERADTGFLEAGDQIGGGGGARRDAPAVRHRADGARAGMAGARRAALGT